jgi:hypothetical protein
MSRLDRRQLKMHPLHERRNLLRITEIAVSPDAPLAALSAQQAAQIARIAERLLAARRAGHPVMLTFGAHLIKNGLAPLVIDLLEHGWITHLATNGAGSIHDWEFAYQGETSEAVRANVAAGSFGAWEETGRFINLAIAVGVATGLGYGSSVAQMIHEEKLTIPALDKLRQAIADGLQANVPGDGIAAQADLLALLSEFSMPAGELAIPHPFKQYSLQAAAYRLGIPFTVHPGVGYDIIYTHPMNSGGAIGRGAVRDYLTYAATISHLQAGVHMTIGSAIMAPMIFEKALSMANNLALQKTSRPNTAHFLVVNDLQPGDDWDWRAGEPPREHPAYYLRFCKTFYRMGGDLVYVALDNRTFLCALHKRLQQEQL